MLDMIAGYKDVFVGTAVVDPEKAVRAFRVYPKTLRGSPWVGRGQKGGDAKGTDCPHAHSRRGR
jgi:hypothetical protein